MTRVKTLVDAEGGHRIGTGVHALRLDQSSRFDPNYVALCLAARWNERYQKGATVKHAKPADLEIPDSHSVDSSNGLQRFAISRG